ncbi:MAG: DUF4492 domain-containing protein [Prolixibacteraceae bacterium]|jgi:hypothetical protein|nr:DUF4492 domain-containing protein [Prolixibacteraceae bacterium]
MYFSLVSHFLMKRILINLFQFYYQGFKSMTIGRKLWAIILIKLIILFVVLRLFFFPNYLKSNFSTDEQRSNHVIEQLTK